MSEEEKILDEKDIGEGVDKEVKLWLTRLELSDDAHKDFIDNGQKIVELYKNIAGGKKDSPTLEETDSLGQIRYNILWSTNKTLRPALYSRTPKVVAERRIERSDPVIVDALRIAEDATSYFMSDYDFDYLMKGCVEDFLLPGRGVAFARFEAEFKADKKRIALQDEEEAPEGYEEEKDDEGRYYEDSEVEREAVICDYIGWEDFRLSPAKRWDDVRWVSKRVRLTKAEFEKRFPNINVKEVNFECKDDKTADEDPSQYEILKHIVVWEIWNKPNRTVYWLSPGYKKKMLDAKKDPLRLKNFFPCPRPLVATTSTDNIIPVADFAIWHQVAKQLDNLSQREVLLTDACKVVGAYDPSCLDLANVFKSDDNEFKPATDWTQIQQAGGLSGVMDFLPIEPIANALATVNQQKQLSLQDFYQLTGFSDVMQGVSNPSVSATAEENKSKYITLRLSESQNEVQRFARDLLSLTTEIIFNHVSDDLIAAITGFDLTNPDAKARFDAAMQLLRNNLLRNIKMTIETDSTITINENIEKGERIEFLNMASNLIGQMSGLAQQVPTFVPAAMELLRFGIRTFRQGKTVEGSIDQAVSEFETALKQPPPPPPPDPKLMEVQQDGQLRTQEMQMNYQLRTAELQQKDQQNQARTQLKLQQMQAQFQLENQKAMSAIESERQKLALEVQKLQLETQRLQLEAMRVREELGIKVQENQTKTALEAEKLKQEANKTAIDSALRAKEAKNNAIQEMADIQTSKEKGQTDRMMAQAAVMSAHNQGIRKDKETKK